MSTIRVRIVKGPSMVDLISGFIHACEKSNQRTPCFSVVPEDNLHATPVEIPLQVWGIRHIENNALLKQKVLFLFLKPTKEAQATIAKVLGHNCKSRNPTHVEIADRAVYDTHTRQGRMDIYLG